MTDFLDSTHYQQLHQELTQLQSAPVPDLAAIDSVIEQLAQEQQRLKSEDGQHGNNPIEWRHRDPPPL